jgi:hypothetical protein
VFHRKRRINLLACCQMSRVTRASPCLTADCRIRHWTHRFGVAYLRVGSLGFHTAVVRCHALTELQDPVTETGGNRRWGSLRILEVLRLRAEEIRQIFNKAVCRSYSVSPPSAASLVNSPADSTDSSESSRSANAMALFRMSAGTVTISQPHSSA